MFECCLWFAVIGCRPLLVFDVYCLLLFVDVRCLLFVVHCLKMVLVVGCVLLVAVCVVCSVLPVVVC